MAPRDNDKQLTNGERPKRAKGGRSAKREAILRGARSVFAHEGYYRSSIDSISREANVSTRTIYNHFLDKADLFRAVISASADAAADAEVGLIDEYLRDGQDPTDELVAFARAWLSPDSADSEHRALVSQIVAEADHIPADATTAWYEAGPLRVRQVLAEKFSAWSKTGALRELDPVQAAVHFTQLIAVAEPGPTSGATTRDESEAWIVSGVRVFLRGYGRDPE